MVYPHRSRNRHGGDIIEVHEVEVKPTTISAATNHTYTINLPYNAWTIGGMFWAENNDVALTVQVKPWVDHGQTVLGNALGVTQLGAAAVVTSLSIAATTPTDGVTFEVVAGTGALASLSSDPVVYGHGIQVIVSCATNLTTGEGEVEIIAVPSN